MVIVDDIVSPETEKFKGWLRDYGWPAETIDLLYAERRWGESFVRCDAQVVTTSTSRRIHRSELERK